MQTLLSLFDSSCDVCRPGEIVSYVQYVFEVVNSLHTISIYKDGRGLHFLKSKINYFVFLCSVSDFFVEHHTVSRRLVTKINPTTVVSSANFIIELETGAGTQSCVYSEYSNGLSTQPCEEPVLSVRVEKTWEPSLTNCGRFVRKSIVQEQMFEESPR